MNHPFLMFLLLTLSTSLIAGLQRKLRGSSQYVVNFRIDRRQKLALRIIKQNSKTLDAGKGINIVESQGEYSEFEKYK